MKRLTYVLAPLLAITMTTPGCETVQAAGQVIAAVQQPADSFFNTLADERAYYGLLAFERSANQLASAAVDMGFMTAGSAASIRVADLLVQLTGIVEAAKTAKRLNDAPGVAAKVAEGKALYQSIMALIGR